MGTINSISGGARKQTKTVTAGTSNKTVTPDEGYLLSSVTVAPTPTQNKSATPTTSTQTIKPDTNYHLGQVTVNAISTQTKTATVASTAQTIKPDSGKYLTGVTVNKLNVTKLHSSSGRTRTQSYTFTQAYTLVIVTVGGYGTNSITTGSGWTATHTENNSTNISQGWYKFNVAANAVLTMSLGDRNGLSIYGIK